MLSFILPVFNEEKILKQAAESFAFHLDRVIKPGNWQFVFVINGSTDDSPEIAEEIVESHSLSKVVIQPKADYGNALREGLRQADGAWSLLANVDHVWDEAFFQWAWDKRYDYDLIIGSKRADPTLNRQSSYRKALSAGLNAVLVYLFDFVGSDTHGMKLLHMTSVRPIAERCVMSRGQFDTELTLRILRESLRVAEVPVTYAEKRSPRNFMIKKIGQNVFDLIRFRRVMIRVPYKGNVRYRRFSREDLLVHGSMNSGDS